MDPQLKARWIEALRSGNYVQGRSYLRTDCPDGRHHCCLGVLAELIDPTKWETDSYLTHPGWDPQYDEDGPRAEFNTLLPSNILGEMVQAQLATMNDDNISFDEIADYIERNL